MKGFDLDGVLAVPPPAPPSPWRMMNSAERAAHTEALIAHYATAETLLKPAGRFCIITARRDRTRVREVTQAWADLHYPGQVTAIHMLDRSRSFENIVGFKRERIVSEGVEWYADDQVNILNRLLGSVGECKLHLYRALERGDLLIPWERRGREPNARRLSMEYDSQMTG